MRSRELQTTLTSIDPFGVRDATARDRNHRKGILGLMHEPEGINRGLDNFITDFVSSSLTIQYT